MNICPIQREQRCQTPQFLLGYIIQQSICIKPGLPELVALQEQGFCQKREGRLHVQPSWQVDATSHFPLSVGLEMGKEKTHLLPARAMVTLWVFFPHVPSTYGSSPKTGPQPLPSLEESFWVMGCLCSSQGQNRLQLVANPGTAQGREKRVEVK